MLDEIIKFRVEHRQEKITDFDISDIITIRQCLQEKGLIGKLKEGKFKGYDYGNISLKHNGKIILSGSQTSSKYAVSEEDFAEVIDYDPESFTINSRGLIIPSSEAPLHWSAYNANPEIKAVIHTHIVDYDFLSKKVLGFFQEMEYPLTASRSKSREIGVEVGKIILESGFERIMGMLNHDGGFGLISLGRNINEAYEELIRIYRDLVLF